MRRLLPVLSIMASSALLLVALAPACSDQCNRSDDCASGEVCYAGVCEQLTRDYVRCASNSDCDMSGRFICRAGRCTIEGVPAVVPADGGDASVDPDGGDASTPIPADGGDAMVTPPDTGTPPPDTGMPPDDAGTPPDTGMTPTSNDEIEATLGAETFTWSMATNAAIEGALINSTQTTRVQGTGNVGGPIQGRIIEINFPGGTPGTFTCDQEGVSIRWDDGQGAVFSAAMNVATSSCTVEVASYGAEGEAILGNISGNLVNNGVGSPLTGSFDVVRDPDLP